MPKDPIMLLSFVNMQLRDNYSTLHELCKAYCVEENDIKFKLKAIDYEYNAQTNQFI